MQAHPSVYTLNTVQVNLHLRVSSSAIALKVKVLCLLEWQVLSNENFGANLYICGVNGEIFSYVADYVVIPIFYYK